MKIAAANLEEDKQSLREALDNGRGVKVLDQQTNDKHPTLPEDSEHEIEVPREANLQQRQHQQAETPLFNQKPTKTHSNDEILEELITDLSEKVITENDKQQQLQLNNLQKENNTIKAEYSLLEKQLELKTSR